MEIKLDKSTLAGKSLFVGTPMYGGQCFGTYMKSCLDLQGLCMQYGIDVKFSFLFNESLINRARVYVSDEFMRSGCTHMIFIDSDISFNPIDVIAMLAIDKEVIGGPYSKKCCLSETKIDTEDGVKTIKWIVDNKYTGKVLSMDSEKNLVWKNVISHSVEPYQKDKKWVSVGVKNRQQIKVTDDHLCAYIEDVFNPSEILYTEAKNMLSKYNIRLPENNDNTDCFNPLYTKDQISFLVGALMGDGSISKGYLKFGHSEAQLDYLKLKTHIFGGKISERKKTGSYKGKEYFGYFSHSPRNAQITALEDLFYDVIDGKKKRTVKNVLSMLDEKGLAMWYMDDGTYGTQVNGAPCVNICSEGFSLEDNSLLVDYLKNKWDLNTTVTKSGRLYLKLESCDKFFNLIKEYIIPSMEYKIPESYRGGNKYVYNNDRLSFGAEKVNDIHYLNTTNPKGDYYNRKLYDIGVEDTHCFFGNGILVHNCIKWPNIKKAILRNPNISENDLAEMSGDLVFNPVGGMTQFNVSELVEVMELGTGFLMIRRSAFEKFQKAYPENFYLPDHVGSEFFSGNREICAFFNVGIDPESRRMWSEDYYFCQKIRKIGVKIWMCPWIQLQHQGFYAFQGSLPKIAQHLQEL